MQTVLAGTLQAVASDVGSGSCRYLRLYRNPRVGRPARRYQNQPDLRRNSNPDTASITIGGNA
ncbi:hypothetical protein SAMN02744784_01964 [Stenotrophomonas sp. CC120223-11]|nr:hypothetical protein SAMN02744784_01964 [Stenotrophomonas sp. CC120223-11]